MENRKAKQNKDITNYPMANGRTSHVFRLHIYTEETETFCPPEANPFSSYKHLI